MVRVWLNKNASIRGGSGRGDLGVVHRIDKDTSGLLVFTRTHKAKRSLDEQLRQHTVERRYLAIAHGRVQAATLESHLVADRGDGVRGSTPDPRIGRNAITHVAPEEFLEGATLVSCRLQTGRTHQIRIHLAEAGHPLVGEKVYIRGLPGPFLPAPRQMLHAALLGFEHPVDGAHLRFEDPMPEDMRKVLASLRPAKPR
jgi:23S rRNA pseudouridine1911/1915/1917 synthase